METTTLILTREQKNYLNKRLAERLSDVRYWRRANPRNLKYDVEEEMIITLMEELNGDSND